MGKYYVITKCIDENFYWELYYDEYTAEQDHFALIENHDFGGLNTDLYKDILTNLDHLYFDLQEDPGYNEDEDTYTEEDALWGLINLVNDHFSKKNGANLTLKETMRLINLATEYAEARRLDEDDIMCDYLEIQWGEPFKHGIMRGSSQSDRVSYICPASLSDEYLEYIEAVIMANGMMAYITNKPVDNPSEELPDNLYDDFYDEYYLPWMSDQELKNYFIKERGIPSTNIEVLDEEEFNSIINTDAEEDKDE